MSSHISFLVLTKKFLLLLPSMTHTRFHTGKKPPNKLFICNAKMHILSASLSLVGQKLSRSWVTVEDSHMLHGEALIIPPSKRWSYLHHFTSPTMGLPKHSYSQRDVCFGLVWIRPLKKPSTNVRHTPSSKHITLQYQSHPLHHSPDRCVLQTSSP